MSDKEMSTYSIELCLAIQRARFEIPESYRLNLSIEHGGDISVKLIDDLGGEHVCNEDPFGENCAVSQISWLTDQAIVFDKAANPINYPVGEIQ